MAGSVEEPGSGAVAEQKAGSVAAEAPSALPAATGAADDDDDDFGDFEEPTAAPPAPAAVHEDVRVTGEQALPAAAAGTGGAADEQEEDEDDGFGDFTSEAAAPAAPAPPPAPAPAPAPEQSAVVDISGLSGDALKDAVSKVWETAFGGAQEPPLTEEEQERLRRMADSAAQAPAVGGEQDLASQHAAAEARLLSSLGLAEVAAKAQQAAPSARKPHAAEVARTFSTGLGDGVTPEALAPAKACAASSLPCSHEAQTQLRGGEAGAPRPNACAQRCGSGVAERVEGESGKQGSSSALHLMDMADVAALPSLSASQSVVDAWRLGLQQQGKSPYAAGMQEEEEEQEEAEPDQALPSRAAPAADALHVLKRLGQRHSYSAWRRELRAWEAQHGMVPLSVVADSPGPGGAPTTRSHRVYVPPDPEVVPTQPEADTGPCLLGDEVPDEAPSRCSQPAESTPQDPLTLTAACSAHTQQCADTGASTLAGCEGSVPVASPSARAALRRASQAGEALDLQTALRVAMAAVDEATSSAAAVVAALDRLQPLPPLSPSGLSAASGGAGSAVRMGGDGSQANAPLSCSAPAQCGASTQHQAQPQQQQERPDGVSLRLQVTGAGGVVCRLLAGDEAQPVPAADTDGSADLQDMRRRRRRSSTSSGLGSGEGAAEPAPGVEDDVFGRLAQTQAGVDVDAAADPGAALELQFGRAVLSALRSMGGAAGPLHAPAPRGGAAAAPHVGELPDPLEGLDPELAAEALTRALARAQRGSGSSSPASPREPADPQEAAQARAVLEALQQGLFRELVTELEARVAAIAPAPPPRPLGMLEAHEADVLRRHEAWVAACEAAEEAAAARREAQRRWDAAAAVEAAVERESRTVVRRVLADVFGSVLMDAASDWAAPDLHPAAPGSTGGVVCRTSDCRSGGGAGACFLTASASHDPQSSACQWALRSAPPHAALAVSLLDDTSAPPAAHGASLPLPAVPDWAHASLIRLSDGGEESAQEAGGDAASAAAAVPELQQGELSPDALKPEPLYGPDNEQPPPPRCTAGSSRPAGGLPSADTAGVCVVHEHQPCASILDVLSPPAPPSDQSHVQLIDLAEAGLLTPRGRSRPGSAIAGLPVPMHSFLGSSTLKPSPNAWQPCPRPSLDLEPQPASRHEPAAARDPLEGLASALPVIATRRASTLPLVRELTAPRPAAPPHATPPSLWLREYKASGSPAAAGLGSVPCSPAAAAAAPQGDGGAAFQSLDPLASPTSGNGGSGAVTPDSGQQQQEGAAGLDLLDAPPATRGACATGSGASTGASGRRGEQAMMRPHSALRLQLDVWPRLTTKAPLAAAAGTPLGLHQKLHSHGVASLHMGMLATADSWVLASVPDTATPRYTAGWLAHTGAGMSPVSSRHSGWPAPAHGVLPFAASPSSRP